jgi:primosomal protein N' (replication factor Y)
MPHVEVIQKERGNRIPERASRIIRKALKEGAVLIESPITGYAQLLSCNNCAQIARCDECSGTLRALKAEKYLVCSKCSKIFNNWACLDCHQNKLRFLRIGSDRLTEEVGKLFPGVVIHNSSSKASGGIIRSVEGVGQIIISTPGAEPLPAKGYAAVVVLDANYWVDLTSLDGTEDTLSLWFYAISLVSPYRGEEERPGEKPKVVVIGSLPPQLQDAVVRLDPRLIMHRELEVRKMNALPPFARCAVIVGQSQALEQLTKYIAPEAIGAQILGPFHLEETSYYKSLEDWSKRSFGADANPLQCVIVKVCVLQGRKMAASILASIVKLHAVGTHSAHKVRYNDIKVLMDPKELL